MQFQRSPPCFSAFRHTHKRPNHFENYFVYLFNASFSKIPFDQKLEFEFPSKRKFNYTKLKINSITVEIFNIHPKPYYYNNESNPDINKDFKFLSNFFENDDIINRNIIILGDFNSYHKEEYKNNSGVDYMKNPHSFLEEKGFCNIYDLKNILFEYDFTGQHLTTIDYIYISKRFLVNFEIVKSEILNINLSDHYPLLLDFKLREQKLLDNSLNWFLSTWYKGTTFFSNFFREDVVFNQKYILKNIYINISDFAEINNYQIIEIPKKSVFCHRTDYIDIKNSEKRPIELQIYLNKKNKSYDLPLILKNDSTVSEYFISESFSYFYGKNIASNFTRKIYFKTNKNIKLIKISGRSKRDRITNRLKMFKKLFFYIIEKNTFLKSFIKSEFLDKDIERNPWLYQPFIQCIMSIITIKSFSFKDNYINKPVGFLIDDAFLSENTINVNSNRYLTHTWYWNKTLMYGREFDIYCKELFVDYIGSDYNNKFYPVKKFFKVYKPIIENALIIKENISVFNQKYDFKNLSQYNLNIIKVMNLEEQYVNILRLTKNKNSKQWFKSIIHHNDEVKLLNNSNNHIFILNLNLNYLILTLLQSRIFYSSTTMNLIDSSYSDSDIENLSFDFSNNKDNKLYNIFLIFEKKIKSKYNYNLNSRNIYRQYVNIILYFTLKYLVVHEYINIPLLTLFKFLFKTDELSELDINYVKIIKNILGSDYVNSIITNNTIQYVSLNKKKCKKDKKDDLFCNYKYFLNQSNDSIEKSNMY